ncbi:sentrin-specific protease 1-like [Mercenaria mercenaria]|uniref:sentrin-specific protease 1-like n=1 Tax=Mercenaria mercenaria TaxID=6596 RepID=UPI00234F9FDE|nr:sentrin-specific protease 1-like [Mercenaria mercenaria]
MSDMETKMKSIQSRISETEKFCEFVAKDSDSIKTEIKDTKNEIKNVKTSFKSFQNKSSDLYEQQSRLEEQMTNLELQSLRNNLLFYGIPEGSATENCEALVKDMCKEYLKIEDADSFTFEKVQRLGKRTGSKNHPTLAKFQFRHQREHVRTVSFDLADDSEAARHGVGAHLGFNLEQLIDLPDSIILNRKISENEAQDERRKSLSEDEVEIVEEEQESLPELTTEMENVINNALSPGNPDQVLVDKFHLQITKGDIARLSGSNWLSDVVINFYMNLLMERGELEGCSKVYAFNTYFYPKMMSGGHSAVKTWTRRVDVLAVHYILIPVHLGKHWCLAVINFKKKDIQYYDSLGGINQKCLYALRQYLCDESMNKKNTEFNLNGWNSTIMKDLPQQMNGSDCGMFACKYAEYIARDAPIIFTPEDMPYFRRRMVYEIVSANLLQ